MHTSHSTLSIIILYKFTASESSVRSWIATRPSGPISTISIHAVVGPRASPTVERMESSFLGKGWTMVNGLFISPYTKVY